jgi:hypothetical protein
MFCPYCARLSQLTSCLRTKYNLYLPHSLATVESDPDLYRLLTFHLPNLMPALHCLARTKRLVHSGSTFFPFRYKASFYGESLAPHPTPKLEDHPLSAVRDCLLNIFAATQHIGGRSSIRHLRTPHSVVTGTHLLWH